MSKELEKHLRALDFNEAAATLSRYREALEKITRFNFLGQEAMIEEAPQALGGE